MPIFFRFHMLFLCMYVFFYKVLYVISWVRQLLSTLILFCSTRNLINAHSDIYVYDRFRAFSELFSIESIKMMRLLENVKKPWRSMETMFISNYSEPQEVHMMMVMMMAMMIIIIMKTIFIIAWFHSMYYDMTLYKMQKRELTEIKTYAI